MRFHPKTPPHLLLPGLAIFLLTLGLGLVFQPHTALALPITHARARAAPHPLVQGVGLLATPRAWHSETNHHHSPTVVKRICDRFNTACATHDNSTTIATVEDVKVAHKHYEVAAKVTERKVEKPGLARGLKAHVIEDKDKRAEGKVMESEVEQVMKRGKRGQEEGEVGSREGGHGAKRRKAKKSRLGTGFTTMAEGKV